MKKTFVILLLFLFPLLNFDSARAQENLGSIDFPVTGSDDAVEAFEEGVLLLHSFEYEDAANAFATAREKDPDMLMAYWGEAMTKNHPIWNQQDREAAQSILQEFASSRELRAQKAQTEREKDYLNTVEILYGEGSKEDRDDLYAEAMAGLSAKYPADLEAKSFYALSILGACQGKRDFRQYMKAGAIAREVYNKNPNHPGAAHYVIHSFDDPIHAPLGLEAAESYASIAPDAAHANHMPSHIFMALGKWKASNATNVRSKMAAKSKGRHGLHATWWLTYGYLQSGQIDLAKAEIEELAEIAKDDKSRSVHSHLAYMLAHFNLEYGDELNAELMQSVELENASGSSEANFLFSKTIQSDLSDEQGQMELGDVLIRLSEISKSDGPYVNSDEIEIMIYQLQAVDAKSRGDFEIAYTLLDKAVEIHEGMAVEFGPPSPVKPLYEFYAELALEAGDVLKAKGLYNKALLDKPGRWQTAQGLMKVAQMNEDKNGLLSNSCYLSELLEDADQRFAELRSNCQGNSATGTD